MVIDSENKAVIAHDPGLLRVADALQSSFVSDILLFCSELLCYEYSTAVIMSCHHARSTASSPSA